MKIGLNGKLRGGGLASAINGLVSLRFICHQSFYCGLYCGMNVSFILLPMEVSIVQREK